ncbi:ATP-binding protein [Sphingosinicella sp. BN140058]|uniref:PAS domain-containing sensor histidine kinase n=1 Tax=Sphingosinicella sp. BN140058 TaxID=1892855 RepID=UPI001010DEBC|nr:ATP-binding protein [Sphingosinicella sp. BN140058]QAY79333.1 GHKL domain-containing protein [Sphingosinicella sp. BN140058]
MVNRGWTRFIASRGEKLSILIAAGLLACLSLRYELFEQLIAFSATHEAWELDEIFVVVFFAGLCSTALLILRARDLRREVAARMTFEAAEHDRVQRERDRLHNLFEQSPSFMAISYGADHRFEFVNSAYETLVQRPRERLIGRTVADVFPAVLRIGIIPIMDDVFRTGTPFSARHVRINLAEDYEDPQFERVINWVCHPYRNSDGAIVGLFSEGTDITEQIAAEEQVRRLTSELIHVARVSAMGTMASTLAHELNQPLTAITNYAATAEIVCKQREVAEDDPLFAALSAIKGASLRAGDIIRRLRRMCARETAKTQPVRVADLVDDALKLALINFAERRPTVRVSVPPSLHVLADPIQIQQVLVNLVRNAAEAMADAPVRSLRLTAEATGALAEISVSDSGPGLSRDALGRLFEPFTTTKADGMGIGLSISRTIVESHGGRISASNAPEGGCTFRFSLRLANQRAHAEAEAAD